MSFYLNQISKQTPNSSRVCLSFKDSILPNELDLPEVNAMSSILSKVIAENVIIEEDTQQLQKEHNELKRDLISYFNDQNYGGTSIRSLSQPPEVRVQSFGTKCKRNS